MTKKKKFGAPFEELDERIPPPPKAGFPLINASEATEYERERSEAESRKLIMLLYHYDLEFRDYRGLSLALAREFIDGFKEAKPKGRRTKWTDEVLGILFVEVKRKRIAMGLKGNRHTDKICSAVAEQAPWDSFLETHGGVGITPDPREAIRQAYYKAEKSKWSQIVWKAYRWHEEKDTVDEWENIILSVVQAAK